MFPSTGSFFEWVIAVFKWIEKIFSWFFCQFYETTNVIFSGNVITRSTQNSNFNKKLK